MVEIDSAVSFMVFISCWQGVFYESGNECIRNLKSMLLISDILSSLTRSQYLILLTISSRKFIPSLTLLAPSGTLKKKILFDSLMRFEN
jgi:hypothetical protein